MANLKLKYLIIENCVRAFVLLQLIATSMKYRAGRMKMQVPGEGGGGVENASTEKSCRKHRQMAQLSMDRAAK